MQRPVDSVACNKDTLLRVRSSYVVFLFQVVWRSTTKFEKYLDAKAMRGRIGRCSRIPSTSTLLQKFLTTNC